MSSFLSQRMQGVEQSLIRRINDMADPSCINLGLGEPSFPTPEKLCDFLKENIDSWHLGYSPNAGIPELRKLIAEKSSSRATVDQVCITVGSEEALFLSLIATVDPGDEVLIPDPGFSTYEVITKIVDGVPKKYTLDPDKNFAFKADDIEKFMSRKTKVIIINSPNNPTGAVYPDGELEKLAAFLMDRQILAISDEVYQDIFFDEFPPSISRHMENCVVINSLSKSFSMTGWRIGWCLFPEEMKTPFIGLHQMAVMCAPVLSQKVAVAAFQGIAEEEKNRNLEELRRRRKLAISCIEKYTDLDYIKPSGTFYILVDVRKKSLRFGSSLDITLNILEKQKVVIIPGEAFGKAGEGFLRLSFAASPKNIEEGIRRIGHFFMI